MIIYYGFWVLLRMDAGGVRDMWSVIAVTSGHAAELHHVVSLYIVTDMFTIMMEEQATLL